MTFQCDCGDKNMQVLRSMPNKKEQLNNAYRTAFLRRIGCLTLKRNKQMFKNCCSNIFSLGSNFS